MAYLFNFKEYIAYMRKDKEKKEIVKHYKQSVGSLEEKLEDTLFWREYLLNFEVPEFVVKKLLTPKELVQDFDWKLLLILIVSSFSSEYDLIITSKGIKIIIEVKNNEGHIIKDIESLWSYQVQRLFEIYVEEQMNLQSAEEESKIDALTSLLDEERRDKLMEFKKHLGRIENYYGHEDEEDILSIIFPN